MTNTNWQEWPQLEFDIEQFEEVQDWVVNRFGDDTCDVVLAGKGSYNFHIAVRDPKVVNIALLKFGEARLQPNQVNKDIIQEEIRKQTDLEIKRLLEELKGRLPNLPTFEDVKNAVAEDAFFSYDNIQVYIDYQVDSVSAKH